MDPDPLADGLHVLEEKIKATPYPYGFEPTMHRYRLNQPERQAEPQTIFVCSMADLFGRWVPTSWIAEVLDACRRAPQHRYLFLTKNPARYLQLDYMGLLPHENNFWYGSTVANEDAAAMYTMQGVAINSFWSMEPLLGPVDMSAAEGLPQWVILGAETGNRADKVAPRREWVDQITQFCAENEIPVFYKDNLRAHFPDLPPSAAAVQNTDRAAKYRNTPTERVTASGAVLRFDSQKEARRYDHLILRQQAGEIRDLRLQVDFTLQEAYTDQEGRRIRAIRYRADFTYYRPPEDGSHAAYWADRAGVPWVLVVEDVKSRPTRTREYLIKRKLMKERRGIDITEV